MSHSCITFKIQEHIKNENSEQYAQKSVSVRIVHAEMYAFKLGKLAHLQNVPPEFQTQF